MDPGQRRLVATMPLHAITTTYGEDGLRERFAAEIARLPASDRDQLNRALDLASLLHAADRRENEPYVNHLLRVTIRIMSQSHYGIDDTGVLTAALLHDAVEDHAAEIAGEDRDPETGDLRTAAGLQQAALAVLSAEFGSRVADLVGAVTNPPWAPGRDEHEQYREHVRESLRRHPWARVIKVSDFTDNGVGLIHITGPRVGRLAAKYAPLVPVLRELIQLPDTPLNAAARQHIQSQLDRAAERFSALRES
jgi:hypothetical protein